jgi:hypothetical protein
MTQHYSFPSIEQYRTVIKYVNDRADRRQVPRPTLTFHGTVKLHGTNASVVISGDEYWAQSRSQVITPEADNAGFAAFAHQPEIKRLLKALAYHAEGVYFASRADYIERYPVDVAIYGEWCGGNIQGGIALNKLSKMFVIFAVRLLSKEDDETKSIWLMPWDVEQAYDAIAPDGVPLVQTTGVAAVMAELPIYCIEKFPTWKLSINFAEPAAAQNELVRITTEVEAECPVGKALGVTGVGEGVVWTCVGGDPTSIMINDLVFKVKGEKHSDTKVKTIGAVDIERLNSIRELAESFATDHRLEKGIAFLRESTEDVYDVKNIGPFLKWVGTDIIKEETDTIVGNGFEVKDVTKAINNIAKEWFLQRSRSNES